MLEGLEKKRIEFKYLTFKETAMYVLWKSQRLMTSNEIVDTAFQLGILKSVTGTSIRNV